MFLNACGRLLVLPVALVLAVGSVVLLDHRQPLSDKLLPSNIDLHRRLLAKSVGTDTSQEMPRHKFVDLGLVPLLETSFIPLHRTEQLFTVT